MEAKGLSLHLCMLGTKGVKLASRIMVIALTCFPLTLVFVIRVYQVLY